MIQLVEKVFKNSFIYSIGNISTKLVGFVLLPLYTSYFSIDQYGILSLAEITSQVFIIFFGFGLSSAFERWYWDLKTEDERKILFFTILTVSLLTVFVTLSLISFNVNEISKLLFNSTDYNYLIQLVFISGSLEIISVLVFSLMRIQEKAKLLVFSNLIKTMLSLSLTVLFIISFNGGLEAVYEASIIGYCCYFFVLLKFIFSNIRLKLRFGRLKEMISYSYPLSFI